MSPSINAPSAAKIMHTIAGIASARISVVIRSEPSIAEAASASASNATSRPLRLRAACPRRIYGSASNASSK
jgi:hypothetical protein